MTAKSFGLFPKKRVRKNEPDIYYEQLDKAMSLLFILPDEDAVEIVDKEVIFEKSPQQTDDQSEVREVTEKTERVRDIKLKRNGGVFWWVFVLLCALLSIFTVTLYYFFKKPRGLNVSRNSNDQPPRGPIMRFVARLKNRWRDTAVDRFSRISKKEPTIYTAERLARFIRQTPHSTVLWEPNLAVTDEQKQIVADQHSFVAGIETLRDGDAELAVRAYDTVNRVAESYVYSTLEYNSVLSERAVALAAVDASGFDVIDPNGNNAEEPHEKPQDTFRISVPEGFINLKTCTLTEIVEYMPGTALDVSDNVREYLRLVIDIKLIVSVRDSTSFTTALANYKGEMFPCILEAIKFFTNKMEEISKNPYTPQDEKEFSLINIVFMAAILGQMVGWVATGAYAIYKFINRKKLKKLDSDLGGGPGGGVAEMLSRAESFGEPAAGSTESMRELELRYKFLQIDKINHSESSVTDLGDSAFKVEQQPLSAEFLTVPQRSISVKTAPNLAPFKRVIEKKVAAFEKEPGQRLTYLDKGNADLASAARDIASGNLNSADVKTASGSYNTVKRDGNQYMIDLKDKSTTVKPFSDSTVVGSIKIDKSLSKLTSDDLNAIKSLDSIPASVTRSSSLDSSVLSNVSTTSTSLAKSNLQATSMLPYKPPTAATRLVRSTASVRGKRLAPV